MTIAPDKRRALGRGLDALLPDTSAKTQSGTGYAAFLCPVEKIAPQKGQPRQRFDDTKIEELAISVREHGLIEPMVVRRVGSTPERYEIIAGERRWRAAQRAGLTEVPVVVKDVSPATAYELALIENVQREDLNPVELAEAFDRLIREQGYTQQTLADRLGKDRTTIANSLRLLKLPARVRAKVIAGELSEGHARALLGASDESTIESLAEKVARGRLSVRATERLVRGDKPAANGKQRGADAKSAAVRDLEARLARHLGARVEVNDTDGHGEIVVRYATLDELDRILDRILAG